MSKEKKNSTSNKKNKKVTETNTKSKDTKKNKSEKNVEKKIIEEAIIENEELELDSDLELEEDFENEELEMDSDFEDDFDDFEEEESIVEEIEEDTKEEIEKETKEETKKDNKKSKENKDSKKESKKSKENKKEIKNEKISKENIKKIEKIAKEKKNSNKSSKLKNLGIFLENNRNIISGFIAGTLLTILVVIIIWPDRIATLKDGTQPVVKVAGKNYTANDLYDRMKSHYSVSQLLDAIDTDILTKKYPENEEMLEEVNSNAEYYINMYEQYYGYTQEEFLSANGFSSYEDYLEYLKLDHRRKKYLEEYVEENLDDDEIQNYYNENVYGDINCQHILVEVSTNTSEDSENSDGKLSDEDAKKLAEEIIDKINDGTSWEDIQEEYKDKITFEDLKYQTWDSDLEESFKTALAEMEDNSYSEEPIKTSYGYHVIHRLDQKKTPSLKKTKDTIIEKLVAEKQSEDENLLYKALIKLREDKNIKFSDTDMKTKYEAYTKKYK